MHSELLLDGISHPYHMAVWAHSPVGLVVACLMVVGFSWMIVQGAILITRKLIEYWEKPATA